MMAEAKIRVTIAQAEVAPTLEAGLELTRDKALQAAAGDAELIVLPETWIPGYPAWLDNCRDAAPYPRIAENSIAVPGPSLDRLRAIAQEAGATLVIGVSERVTRGAGRGTLYNSLLTIGPDGRLLNHTERLIWGAGDVEGLRAVTRRWAE